MASLLSAQLLRPTGVRSLLLVVISPGSAAGGDDDVSFKKLDMLTRLLGAKPSSDQQVDEKVRVQDTLVSSPISADTLVAH